MLKHFCDERSFRVQIINHFVCKRDVTNARMQTCVGSICIVTRTGDFRWSGLQGVMLSWIVTPADAWATVYAEHRIRENAGILAEGRVGSSVSTIIEPVIAEAREKLLKWEMALIRCNREDRFASIDVDEGAGSLTPERLLPFSEISTLQ